MRKGNSGRNVSENVFSSYDKHRAIYMVDKYGRIIIHPILYSCTINRKISIYGIESICI